jgi:hypothetical protein
MAAVLSREFDQDFSKIIHYIQVKLDWPLSFKHFLLHHVRRDESANHDKFQNIANFVFDPTATIKRRRHFRFLLPTIASVERQYGSGVCSIFHLQQGFFLINLLTLILWLSLITLPYKILTSSKTFSNGSFSFSSIFTTKDYLSESVLFQGSYPNEIVNNQYNLPLIYFLTTYIYFFIWFIFITIRFSSAYKRKVFHSILHSKLDLGFTCTFGRYNYRKESDENNAIQKNTFERSYLDLVGNDERIQKIHLIKYQTFGYKFKLFITNLFYILLAIALGRQQEEFYFILPFLFAINRLYQLDDFIFL